MYIKMKKKKIILFRDATKAEQEGEDQPAGECGEQTGGLKKVARVGFWEEKQTLKGSGDSKWVSGGAILNPQRRDQSKGPG